MANWGKGLALAMMSLGNSLSKQSEKKQDFNQALELAKAKAKAERDAKLADPMDMVDSATKTWLTLNNPELRKQYEQAGYVLPDMGKIGYQDFIKMKTPGGIGATNGGGLFTRPGETY